MCKPEKLTYWSFWNDLRLFLNSILASAHFIHFSGTFVKKKEKEKEKEKEKKRISLEYYCFLNGNRS